MTVTSSRFPDIGDGQEFATSRHRWRSRLPDVDDGHEFETFRRRWRSRVRDFHTSIFSNNQDENRMKNGCLFCFCSVLIDFVVLSVLIRPLWFGLPIIMSMDLRETAWWIVWTAPPPPPPPHLRPPQATLLTALMPPPPPPPPGVDER